MKSASGFITHLWVNKISNSKVFIILCTSKLASLISNLHLKRKVNCRGARLYSLINEVVDMLIFSLMRDEYCSLFDRGQCPSKFKAVWNLI